MRTLIDDFERAFRGSTHKLAGDLLVVLRTGGLLSTDVADSAVLKAVEDDINRFVFGDGSD